MKYENVLYGWMEMWIKVEIERMKTLANEVTTGYN
jgi:hypothetical protein